MTVEGPRKGWLVTLRGLGKASGWPSENLERVIGDCQRTQEGQWTAIRGPRKESG